MQKRLRSVLCPKCDMRTDIRITEETDILHDGSPYRVCGTCGATYFDPDYHEYAIDYYNSIGGEIGIAGFLWIIITNGILAYMIFTSLKTKTIVWGLFLFWSGLTLLSDVGVIRLVRNIMKADEFHQEQIDRLEGRSGAISDELAASLERVSDRRYLDALRSHGVDVPEYFYKRPGSREGTFAEPEGVEEVKKVSKFRYSI